MELNTKIIDGIEYKRCTKHYHYYPNENEWLPATDEFFYRNNANSKLQPYCRECAKKKYLDWKHNNPKKNKRLYDKWNHSEKGRAYRLRNNKNYRDRGGQREWARKHPDRIKFYANKKHKHTITNKEWEQCKKYFTHRCAYCGLKIEDHYITRRGITKLGDFHKEHVVDCGKDTLGNCIPSCGQCNSEKNDKSLNNWYNINNPKYSYERYHQIYLWIRYDYKKYIMPNKKRK